MSEKDYSKSFTIVRHPQKLGKYLYFDFEIPACKKKAYRDDFSANIIKKFIYKKI